MLYSRQTQIRKLILYIAYSIISNPGKQQKEENGKLFFSFVKRRDRCSLVLLQQEHLFGTR